MLASWFRLKYPHVAMGALASSAPILQFDDITPWSSFYDAASQDFKVIYPYSILTCVITKNLVNFFAMAHCHPAHRWTESQNLLGFGLVKGGTVCTSLNWRCVGRYYCTANQSCLQRCEHLSLHRQLVGVSVLALVWGFGHVYIRTNEHWLIAIFNGFQYLSPTCLLRFFQ